MNERAIRPGLLRAAVGAVPPAQPTDADWAEWLAFARANRVVPLLHSIVERETGSLSDDRREAVEAAQLHVMGTMVRFEHDLVEVADALEAATIPFAVVKGAATAHLDYSDPSLRQFGDVDLLVAPSDLRRALATLAATGWVQAYPLPRGHDVTTHAITVRNGKRVEIDVHQRIGHRALGRLVPSEELLARTVELRIGSATLRALDGADRLIHAALHALASRGEYRRLSSTADVLVLSRSIGSDAPAVLARAEGWRVRPLVERAIRDAYAEAQLALPEGWGGAMAAPLRRRDRLVERAYLSVSRRPLLEELAFLRRMDTWRQRGMYLAGYFTLDEQYANKNRRHSLAAQLAYLWSRLRSGRGSSPA